MDDTIRALSGFYAQTLSTDAGVRKQAEISIKNLSVQPNFGLTVLKLVSLDTLPLEIRQAAAVTFKNHVKYRWVARETDSLTGVQQPPLPEDEKSQIKALITGLMLSTPPVVRSQISEALSIISSHDFPAAWPTLLPELVDKLRGGDPATVNGVLLTAASIYDRYRGQYMSEKLNKELEYSQNFVKPLLDVFVGLRAQVEANANAAEPLRLALSSARYAVEIFYSLNSPGLTEAFEATLDAWMDEFHYYLQYTTPLLNDNDPERETPPDGVKAAVCASLHLFMEKNEEEFEKYLQRFASDVWQLLVGVTQRPGQDALAMAAVRFLTAVARSVHHGLFGSADVLKQICENIVVPNLQLREEDEELFESNYVDYIRRDTEGSDQDTRRRVACELVKALTEKFPEQTTALFTEYVAAMLASYAASPAVNWKAKDCAMYLVTALTVKGSTQAAGVTATNQLVNIGDFFTQQVLPELQSPDINALPVLKADALKFVTNFRAHIPKQQCLALFPNLVALLGADANVVHSYAAIAIERLLAMKEHGAPRFTPADLASILEPLLTHLFAAFTKPDSAENEYVMKAVMRTISFVGVQIAPVAPAALQQLSQMLLAVCKNPTQPGFNHYLFESIAALVKHGCAADPAMLGRLEEAVFPAFQLVLTEDVQEFHPYVFQIFAQLIELRPPPVAPVYLQLLPGLLSPTFWERAGNVPALVRLVQAYLSKGAAEVVAAGQLQPLLGVFQKLLASKVHDHEGFRVLHAIVVYVAPDALQPFLPTVWQLLLQRLQTARTPKYQRLFVGFVALVIAKQGVPAARDALNSMQPGLFLMLLTNVIVPTLPTIHGEPEEKVAVVGATRVLCEAAEVTEPAQHQLWGSLLAAVVQVLEGHQANGGEGDEEDLQEEYSGYSAAFAALHNAAAAPVDPLPDVADPKRYLASSLASLSSRHPGTVRQLVATMVPETAQQALQSYCSSAGVLIA